MGYMPQVSDVKIVELKFNEPKIKVLNLKLAYNSQEFWRTGLDIYFLYKLHLTRFNRSLRPSFPTGLLDLYFPVSVDLEAQREYFDKLKGRIEHFFECFLKFVTLKFPKELDSADVNILPVQEWFPSTSRFIRSSISRLRQRSPSPHLGLDSVEIEIKSYDDERMLQRQRLRLADLEPVRTDLIPLKIDNDDLIQIKEIFKETTDLEHRTNLLKQSLKSVTYLLNTLYGCKSLISEINSVFKDSETDVFEGFEEINTSIIDSIDDNYDLLTDQIKYPLNIQLDDVYSLTRGVNERTFSLKTLDSAISDQKRACHQLLQIQSESIAAMDRAQGSLSGLSSSSYIFDRKIAAKNAEIEKRIKAVEECTKDFESIDKYVSTNLSKWERNSDTFLVYRLKALSTASQE